jgi:hypothetical protein
MHVTQVVSGWPMFTAIYVSGILPSLPNGEDPLWARKVVLAIDCLLYCFLPLFFCILLRIIQGRQLFARLGKRTIVVGDVPYVNQLLESYVSKLFAESYSIASVECHGSNAIDHLVHRFTHRVTRYGFLPSFLFVFIYIYIYIYANIHVRTYACVECTCTVFLISVGKTHGVVFIFIHTQHKHTYIHAYIQRTPHRRGTP